MAGISAVAKAISNLTLADSLADVLGVAYAAAEAGEVAATELARDSVLFGPGYLVAADAFAAVRLELENWADVSPSASPIASGGSARLYLDLVELSALLADRLAGVAALGEGEVAATIVRAQAAAAAAVRALSGSVRDDADVR